jgi:hypothetical protein
MRPIIDKPKHNLTRVVALTTSVAAAAAVGSVAYYRSIDGVKPEVIPVTQTTNTSPASVPLSGGADLTKPPAPTPLPAPNETRTAMIDRLVASGKAADAQAAFRVIEACVVARRMEPYAAAATEDVVKAVYKRNFPAPTQACEGVLAGHVTQRLPLAIRAAEAGLPRSYADLWGLGAQDPFVQNDPAYVSAFPAIRDAAVQRADRDALMGRYLYLSNCNDPPKCSNVDLQEALKLWTAYVEVGGLKQNRDTVTPQLSKALTPEQSIVAINKGHALVAAARERK